MATGQRRQEIEWTNPQNEHVARGSGHVCHTYQEAQGHGRRLRRSTFNASLSPGVARHSPLVLAKEIWTLSLFKERYSEELNSRGGMTPPTGPDGCATKPTQIRLSLFVNFPHPVQVVY